MKHSALFSTKIFITLLTAVTALLLVSSGAQAILVSYDTVTIIPEGAPPSFVIKPDTLYTGDMSDDFTDKDETGFQIYSDPENSEGQVVVDWIPTPDAQIDNGFVLLDNTLRVQTDLTAGSYRLGLRRAFVRSNIRAAGIRARSLRVFRLRQIGREQVRWEAVPAYKRIAKRGRADIRRIFGRSTFKLGNYGIALQDQYAWSVIDNGGYFAIGGLMVPEPSTWVLLGTGLTGLYLTRRGRRKVRSD